MGVETPISVSMKLGDIGNLFRRIVDAAQRPHLSIPETEAGRSTKHYRRLIQQSVGVAAGKFGTLPLNHSPFCKYRAFTTLGIKFCKSLT